MKICTIVLLLLTGLVLNSLLLAQSTTYELKQRVLYFETGNLIDSTAVMDALPGGTAYEANFSSSQQNIVVGNGIFYHVYYDDSSGDFDIYLRYSADGINWSTPVQVNDDSLNSDQSSPSIAIYNNGGNVTIFVAWQDLRDTFRQIRGAVSTDGGQNFSPSIAISSFNEDSRGIYPNIALAENGVLYAICYRVVSSWGGTDGKVWFSKSTDNGLTWSNMINIWDNQRGHDFPPDIVAWNQNLMVINPRNPGINAFPIDLYYLSSNDSGDTWSTPAPIVQYGNPWDAKFPSAVVDDNGVVYTLFFRGQWSGDSSRFVFSKSSDWGQNWTGEIRIQDSTTVKINWGSHWMSSSLAISDNGNLYAVWQDERQNLSSNNYDIYLSYSIDGGQSWSSDTLINDHTDRLQYHPSVSVKSGVIDTVLIVWQEERVPTGIDDGSSFSPTGFRLEQNYPNPFNPATTIRFEVPLLGGVRGGLVTLKVYDILGKEVQTLVNEELAPGKYTVKWNGTNDAGQAVSSGMYFYRLEAGEFQQIRKMLLVR